MQTRKQQSGFTLIEVMVVVVILGILAAVIVPKIMDKPDEARLVKVKADIQQIQSTLEMYRLDNYVYPSTEQGLQALVQKPSANPEPAHWKQYLDQLPVDPWGHPYQYLNPGTHGTAVDIWSNGADGTPGGEGVNGDMGNWNMNGNAANGGH
ncbi:MAG TPA: type II secretion system major pseudopilin GspG [Gammaproteobacteria bacterium]|jgi:general secretion pathway protein G|nr:type II secretion system major pseudopilin GspG [Gammaproteobacteria bacterium]